MNEIEQSLLLGSFIRVQETSITGNEISPMSILRSMKQKTWLVSDYIFREFGDDILLEIEDLPLTVSVFKTDHTECYGIINLGYGGVVIPYHGVLLFLSRKVTFSYSLIVHFDYIIS